MQQVHIITTHTMMSFVQANRPELSEAYEWFKTYSHKCHFPFCRRTGVSCQRRMSGATSTGTAARRLSCTRPGTSTTTSSSASTSSCRASPSWRCSTWLQPSSEPRSALVPTSSSGLLLLLVFFFSSFSSASSSSSSTSSASSSASLLLLHA